MIPELTSLTKTGSAPDPKEIAAKVQGMFMEVMLKAMEESVGAEEGLFGSSMSSDMYRGMLREHLASAMSQRMQNPLEHALTAQADNETVGAVYDSPGSGAPRSASAIARSLRYEPPLQSEHHLPVDGVITSPQGWRRDPINGERRYHAGTDIAAPAGTPIQAVAEGRVIESGVKGGYGNAVVIETDDGRKMLYAHNNRNLVRVGDWVSRGEAIAEVGSTGRATGPHVHFEVKF